MARTTKTKQVMDLLNNGGEKLNPLFPSKQQKKKPLCITDAKKQADFSLPDVQRNPALSINFTDSGSETRYKWNYGGRQILNIITMLINDELGMVLERFNICDCERCCKFITQKALEELPAVFVQAKCKADEQAVNAELSKYRSTVIKTLTKIAISLKNNPLHLNQRYGNL